MLPLTETQVHNFMRAYRKDFSCYMLSCGKVVKVTARIQRGLVTFENKEKYEEINET